MNSVSDNDGANASNDELSGANGAGASGQRKRQETYGNDILSDNDKTVGDNHGANTSDDEFSDADGAGASGQR